MGTMIKDEIETMLFSTPQEWRKWLKKNHRTQKYIWLLHYKKGAAEKSISYFEALDEALCFGWIDSTRRTVDAHRYKQLFCKRNPNGVWSKINKAKVQVLIDAKKMTPAGLESIATAQQNGTWSILDDVEELKVPKDLSDAFKKEPEAKKYFLSLSKSVKKRILHWIVLAKRAETRENRIAVVVKHAAKKTLPRQLIG